MIKVAVLGLGQMGATHVEAAQASPYVSQIYGYEPDEARRNERAAELKITPLTLEEILADESIQMVDIVASNDAHVPLAKAALLAGKKVLCEKPMGVTLAEAQDLLNTRQKCNGFLQIGFELHYSRMYQIMKEWIDAGLIGRVVNVAIRYYCSEFHRANTWRSKGTGSFLISEKLSHYLDLQRWYYAGQEKPASVYSISAPKVVSYFNHRDNHQISIKFSKGGIATLNFIMYSASRYHKDPLQEMLAQQAQDGHCLSCLICGTKGVIESDVFNRRIRRWQFSMVESGLENQIVENISFTPEEDNYYFHCVKEQNLRVYELVDKGLPPDVPAEDAFETMRLCFAAEQSEDSGEIIRL